MSWHERMEAMTAAYQWARRPDQRHIRVGQRDLNVAVADTPLKWAAGMSVCPDGVDGMLFDFPPGTTFSFHLSDVPHPLVVAFFDDDGRCIDWRILTKDSGPCRASQPYRWALELTNYNPTMISELGGGLDVL